MPRITKPLSSTEVKNAKPKEKEYTLRDGGGLYLRITPTGSRIWLFDYYRVARRRK
ncbi:integrase arm-type DNA-binding domain-containing protein [Aeromonas veronii]